MTHSGWSSSLCLLKRLASDGLRMAAVDTLKRYLSEAGKHVPCPTPSLLYGRGRTCLCLNILVRPQKRGAC